MRGTHPPPCMSATPTSFGWRCCRPRTARGVVVVDPPYEQPDERARITATLAAAHRKWAHGVTVIWYPLKDRATHSRWKGQLRKLGIPEMLTVEHWLHDSEQRPASITARASISSIRPTLSRRRCRLCSKPCAPLAPEGHKGEITTDWLGESW